jgi:glucose-1-phosphate adenylyltransferase
MVGKGSIIKESVIMPDAIIGNNCLIEKAIVPGDVVVPDGTVIRSFDDDIILVTEEMLSGLYPAF